MSNIAINLEGVVLAFLMLGISGLILGLNPLIKKVTDTYWFWLGIAVFYITYCICICWATYWNALAHIDLSKILTPEETRIVSKALILDICPFLNFFLPAALIADPTRKAARSLSPLAIVAGIAFCFFRLPTVPDAKLNWHYIFIGSSGNPNLYYFGHAMNMFIGLGVILNTPKFGWKGSISTISALTGLFLYVVIISRSLGCYSGVAGTHINDFAEGGVFHIMTIIFGNNTILAQVMYFILLYTGLFGVVLLIDLCKRKYFAYGDKYSGIWWQYYDYNKTTVKEPWGWFSHNWQLKHKHTIKK